MFEYYFLLTLKNGSTIDVPAGKASFIPDAGAKTGIESSAVAADAEARRDVRQVPIKRVTMAQWDQDPCSKPECVSDFDRLMNTLKLKHIARRT